MSSFPSGHTATAFAAATALIYGFRSRRRYLFLLPAGFVGLSRVACGAHFPLDVAAGAVARRGPLVRVCCACSSRSTGSRAIPTRERVPRARPDAVRS